MTIASRLARYLARGAPATGKTGKPVRGLLVFATLTERDARVLRRLHRRRYWTDAELAAAFGISASHVHSIVVGRYWSEERAAR